MTAKKSFECNLCRSPIRQGLEGIGIDGRGFAFGSKRVEWMSIHQAENHICDHCVAILIVSFQDSGIVEQFGGVVGSPKP
jgi:hypothetical protein